MNGDPFEEDAEAWSSDPAFLDDEVALAMTGFFMLVRLEPRDMALARIGVEAVVRSLRDSVGPDAPTLGMMGVPTLIEDALTRAALADASPAAREALGRTRAGRGDPGPGRHRAGRGAHPYGHPRRQRAACRRRRAGLMRPAVGIGHNARRCRPGDRLDAC